MGLTAPHQPPQSYEYPRCRRFDIPFDERIPSRVILVRAGAHHVGEWFLRCSVDLQTDVFDRATCETQVLRLGPAGI